MNTHRGSGRRGFLGQAIAAAAGLAVARVCAQPRARPEKSRIAIAVEGRTSFAYLPIVLAERLGYFASEGLEVELIDVDGPLRPNHASPDGGGDLLGGSFDHTLEWQLRSVYMRSVVLLGRSPQVALGVGARVTPAVRSLADLRGRRIGFVASAPMARLVAMQAVSRAGLVPAQVQFTEFAQPAAGVAALRAGQVDALCATEPALTTLESRGEIRVLADTRTLKGTQELFGGAMPAAALFAPQEFLQKHPIAVQAVVDATVHALKWLQTAGPSDIIRAVPDPYLHGDRGLYLASFNKVRETFAVDGLVSDEGARTALRALGRTDPAFRPERVDLARSYTNEFARRAKERFHA